MPYTLVHTVIGSQDTPLILPPLLTTPTLAIEIRNRSQRNRDWTRAGYATAIAETNVGEVAGRSETVYFGRTEVKLQIPAYPYRLRFTPWRWNFAWDLDLFTKDRSGSDGSPSVPLTEIPKGRVRRTIFYTPNTVPTQVLEQRENRTSATLYNASTSLIYIGFSSNLTPSNAPETLYPGGQWITDGVDIGEIWMISDTESSTSLQIIEYAQD